MTTGMTHHDARESLEALALDVLDATERSAVLAHVRQCAACRNELAALEQATEELAWAAEPVAMSPAQRDRVRARLLARAGADRAEMPGAAVVPIGTALGAESARSRMNPWWLAMAASIVAIASVGVLARTVSERDRLRESLRVASAERGARAAALDSLQAGVADRDRMIANLTGPDVAVMTLASNDPASPTARMFWDQAHGTWVFVAHHLGHPKTGRAYQLWLVTPTSKISAGMFMPGTSGDAMMRTTYALPKDSLAAIAVTEEPEAGSAQPTTAPLLLATSR